MANYFLADTSSLIYAYRAGGPQLLDTYVDLAEAGQHEFAISRTVSDEIRAGPLGDNLLQYIADRRIPIIEAPDTEEPLRSVVDPEERKRLSKNAGERSLLEIATREHAEGRNVVIWSDDKHFASPQIQRQLQQELPGLQTKTTAELLDQSFRDNFITEAEYQQHLAGYRTQSVFQESPRLNSFDPPLSGAAADLAEGDVSLRAPNGQRGFASTEFLIGESPRHTLLRSGGLLATGIDASLSARRVADQLDQNNSTAAQSEAQHAVARNAGGWIGGASVGVIATAASTGPGVVGFIVIGGAAVAGSHVGEHVADVLDSYKTFKQTDRDGVHWQSNGRQWVRQDLGDMLDDGQNKPVMQTFSADPEKANELNYRASNVATELAMGTLPPPRNPYSQAAAQGDPVSLRRADWERNPQTGAWDRNVIVGFEQPGVPIIRVDSASAERAAELDRASAQVIRDNIANGPTPIAARYQMVHRGEGWERFGVVPPSIQSALRDDSLIASDGKLYQRAADGQWQRNGEAGIAAGNLRQELESTRAVLQPQLAQHEQQVAAIAQRQPPTLEDIERTDLLATYKVHNVNPKPEQLEAALEAVRRTQHEHGVAPLATSLHLGRNARGGFDIDSPIEHIGRDADGANRVQAVTSPLEVQLAMLDLRSPPPTTPQPPELRIANLSPQQHDALEQVVREANRLGLTRDDVQDAAKQAVAGAIEADRLPELVGGLADADARRAPRSPEVPREPQTSSPAPTKPLPDTLTSETPQTSQATQPRTDGAHSSSEPPQAEASVAMPAPAAVAAAAAPIRDADAVRVVASPEPAPVVAAAPTLAVAEANRPTPTIEPVPAFASVPHQTEAAAVSASAAVPAPDGATAIRNHEATPSPATPAQEVALDDGSLRRDDRGQDVELLQYRQQRVGYQSPGGAPLPQHGEYDTATEQAVRQFQSDQGLPDTGVADPTTQQTILAAQHARIESQKAADQTAPTPTQESVHDVARATTTEPAQTTRAHDAVAQTDAGMRNAASNETRADAADRTIDLSAPVQRAEHAAAEPAPRTPTAADVETHARGGSAMDVSRLSPNDQAMFAKIRGNVSTDVPDETVAALMLAAKRNGIADAGSIGPIGAANGKLWLGKDVPGFHTSVSLSEPPPALQDTVRETQAFNRQRDQQLAQEAAQRGQDDPGRGAKL
ncbi:peptidoglycan-binding domain-containing protein [Lysobacter capsici]|uniref:peptidoglycan-binding domain-containing protein n=1 Tax=Lysobacter capsici TaxID=435897 RepID=UPI0009EC04A6|nr:peptidoglycan-binding domain-containing protein [Lysobacter capsici]